jgi:hypothetical protein
MAAFDANQMAATIMGEVASVRTARPDAAILAAGAGTPDFCNIWPKAKPILELLAGIAIFIPGAGATAGAVLQGLIKIGDQMSSQLCGGR